MLMSIDTFNVSGNYCVFFNAQADHCGGGQHGQALSNREKNIVVFQILGELS